MTDAKRRILARRARFMTAAIASAGLAATTVLGATAEGCGGEVEQTPEAADAEADALSDGALLDDTHPSVCLTAAPPDTALQDTESVDVRDTSVGDARDASMADTGPEPCLFAPLDDTGPAPCLKMPFDSGND